jgi:arylsulfatase A-like enzyme
VVDVPALNLDLFPTLLSAAGLALPTDRVIDGRDLSPLLTGESGSSPHEFLYLYHHGELEGIRSGTWKDFRNTSHYVWPMPVNKKLGRLANHTTGPAPLLFDLGTDPGEAYDLAGRFPEVMDRLEAAMVAWETEMGANPLGFRER